MTGNAGCPLDRIEKSRSGDEFFIILNGGANAVNGTFSGLPEGSFFNAGGDTFRISYIDSGDATLLNDISLTVIAIPEPSTWIGSARRWRWG